MIRSIRRRIRAGEEHLASQGMHDLIPMFRRTMWTILLLKRILAALIVVEAMGAAVVAVYLLV